jgi:hypothetical protein
MKTQAMGWLMAGVLAAGLNASYHDGGLQWAHELADRVEHGSAAVVALASGNAERFLSEAQLVSAKNETASCRLSAALARAHARLARGENRFSRFNDFPARQDAQLAWLDANRDRMEAQIQAQVDAQTARRQLPPGRGSHARGPGVPANSLEQHSCEHSAHALGPRFSSADRRRFERRRIQQRPDLTSSSSWERRARQTSRAPFFLPCGAGALARVSPRFMLRREQRPHHVALSWRYSFRFPSVQNINILSTVHTANAAIVKKLSDSSRQLT